MLKKVILIIVILFSFLPFKVVAEEQEINDIILDSVQNSDGSFCFQASINGKTINEYDYCWHLDPYGDYKEVKNSPAEYHTGYLNSDEDIYIAHDIYYFPAFDIEDFSKVVYKDEGQWAYYYKNEKYQQYLLATLPLENNQFPATMVHDEKQAYNNAVLHINKPGIYRLRGKWHGQIWIDLGEDSISNKSASVTLILDNVDISCEVNSAICFYRVYQSAALATMGINGLTNIGQDDYGANIVIADDSINNLNGSNLTRILKTKYKNDSSNESIKEQKKRLKIDACLYSYQNMSISCQEKANGILNIESQYEGIGCECHLTINGGNIDISAANDGINANQDDESVVTINKGKLNIYAGKGFEGDGIDSNGYIVINGGQIISCAKEDSDSGLDSNLGSYINAGTVLAFGSGKDVVKSSIEHNKAVVLNLYFQQKESSLNQLVITDTDNNVIVGYDLRKCTLFNDFSREYLCLEISADSLKLNGEYYIYLIAEGATKQSDYIFYKDENLNFAKQLYHENGEIFKTKSNVNNYQDVIIGEMNVHQEPRSIYLYVVLIVIVILSMIVFMTIFRKVFRKSVCE